MGLGTHQQSRHPLRWLCLLAFPHDHISGVVWEVVAGRRCTVIDNVQGDNLSADPGAVPPAQ